MKKNFFFAADFGNPKDHSYVSHHAEYIYIKDKTSPGMKSLMESLRGPSTSSVSTAAMWLASVNGKLS